MLSNTARFASSITSEIVTFGRPGDGSPETFVGVAYLRFASVDRAFGSADDFEREIQMLHTGLRQLIQPSGCLFEGSALRFQPTSWIYLGETMPETWFVTGASAGIGREVTAQLLAAGHRVAATARRPEVLEDLAATYPDLLWTAPLDVTDTAALREVVDRAFAELGRIDVIFSNAGRGSVGAAEELSDEVIDSQIALNLTAPIQLFRATLPHLRAQGGGRFIQLSTMGSQITTPGASMYHASKWGVEGFFESVIGEVEPFGVGITMVEPGIIRTTFGANLDVAEPLPAYAETPIGQLHAYLASADNITAAAPGDPTKVAAAIITSAETSPAPRRLALGSDAYDAIRAALTGRLSELEDGRDIARSTDFPA